MVFTISGKESSKPCLYDIWPKPDSGHDYYKLELSRENVIEKIIVGMIRTVKIKIPSKNNFNVRNTFWSFLHHQFKTGLTNRL